MDLRGALLNRSGNSYLLFSGGSDDVLAMSVVTSTMYLEVLETRIPKVLRIFYLKKDTAPPGE